MWNAEEAANVVQGLGDISGNQPSLGSGCEVLKSADILARASEIENHRPHFHFSQHGQTTSLTALQPNGSRGPPDFRRPRRIEGPEGKRERRLTSVSAGHPLNLCLGRA